MKYIKSSEYLENLLITTIFSGTNLLIHNICTTHHIDIIIIDTHINNLIDGKIDYDVEKFNTSFS